MTAEDRDYRANLLYVSPYCYSLIEANPRVWLPTPASSESAAY